MTEVATIVEHPHYIVNEDETELHSVVSVSGRDIISDQTIDFGAAEAEAFFALPPFEGERPFRKSHVLYLMRCIKRKTHLPEDIIIKTCLVGTGRTAPEYRINGQHTCSAILSLAKKHPKLHLSLRVIRYRVKTMQEMRTLYANTDRGASRTVANQLVALMATEEGFANLRQDTVIRLGEGIAQFAFKTSHERREADPDVRASMLKNELREAALEIGTMLETFKVEQTFHVRRGPTIAAMFATWEKAPRIAKQFWLGVIDGDTITGQHNTQRRLRDWLRDVSIRNHGKTREIASSEKVYQQCLRLWGLYRANEPVKSMSFKVTQTAKLRPVAK